MKTAFVTLLAFSGLLSATPVTTQTVTLTGAGSPAVTQQVGPENVYIGPYTLTMGGQSIAALCVDFADDSQLNTSWSAYVTNLSASDLSTTYHPKSATQYKQAAYLFNLITKTGVSAEDRTAIQDAAWFIFDSADLKGVMNSKSNAYYTDAVNYAGSINASQFALVSSIDPVQNRQQEFMISAVTPTPEPGSLALLGAGMTIAGLVIYRRQRPQSRQAEALSRVE